MLQSLPRSVPLSCLPRSDSSRFCTLSGGFVGLFECQVCCPALVHHENISCLMCSFSFAFFFLMIFFFLLSPQQYCERNEESARNTTDCGNESYSDLQNGKGSEWELGRWGSSAVMDFSLFLNHGVWTIFSSVDCLLLCLFLILLGAMCLVMHLIQRAIQLKPLSLQLWAYGILLSIFFQCIF